MKWPPKNVIASAALMGAFSLLALGLTAAVHSCAQARIEENRRLALLKTLETLLPPQSFDNDILTDYLDAQDDALGPRPIPVYRARKAGEPVALVLAPVAPDGYNGEIRLLAAILANGTLAGARVLSHRETPGLGDFIDARKSGWIRGFDGLSLARPPISQWKVKRDGGVFDQFAGATVTPRAVVKAVRNALAYVERNRRSLFAQAARSYAPSEIDGE
jgi:electron transport complex protein RnfG